MSYPPPPSDPSGYGYGGGYAQPVTNKKAIWSLVLGILSLVCCGFLAGVPAIILGSSAKREIESSGGMQAGGGMAQAGFILGIISVVLGLIYILLLLTGTIAFPTFNATTTTTP